MKFPGYTRRELREKPVKDRLWLFRRCVLTCASLAVSLASAQLPPPPLPSSAAKPESASATAPAFDVVSIRRNNTATDGHHHIYNDPGESHFRTVNLSLKDLIQFAYGLPKSQILGGPPWLDSTMFDIDAKSDPLMDAQLHKLASDQARQQKQLMVQAVLADRFRLAAHQETRQLPVYALVVVKGGPKFKSSKINGTTVDTGRSVCTSRVATTPSPSSLASSPRSWGASSSMTLGYPADMTSLSYGPPTMHRRRRSTEHPISMRPRYLHGNPGTARPQTRIHQRPGSRSCHRPR